MLNAAVDECAGTTLDDEDGRILVGHGAHTAAPAPGTALACGVGPAPALRVGRVFSSAATSQIAASRSRTLQVPATSWTRTSLQPPAIPIAAEAKEALRRSSRPISSTTPRKVLF